MNNRTQPTKKRISISNNVTFKTFGGRFAFIDLPWRSYSIATHMPINAKTWNKITDSNLPENNKNLSDILGRVLAKL